MTLPITVPLRASATCRLPLSSRPTAVACSRLSLAPAKHRRSSRRISSLRSKQGLRFQNTQTNGVWITFKLTGPYGGHIQENPMQDFIDFIDYVSTFYGPGGVYDMGVTRLDVAIATGYYLSGINLSDFAADSIDREHVRDVLTEKMGYTFPVEKSSCTA
jgi:hypothetical protein